MKNQTKNFGSPISEAELRNLLLEYRDENWRGIQLPQIQRKIVEDTLQGDALGPLRLLKEYVSISSFSRILDVGSGVGSFVVACREQGLQAFGMEPDKIGAGAKITSIEIARRRLTSSFFVNGIGEQLPFPDACFDAIVMNQVIEHVTDQAAVVKEAARSLRPGGAMYVACPNYLRFYEPHYKIAWFPLLPKAFARQYLRLRGRRAAMLEQITYTTNGRLKRLLNTLGPEFEVLDIHREQFMKKRSAGTFSAPLTRFIARLTNLPVLGTILLRMIMSYAAVAEGGCEMLVLRKPRMPAS